MDAAIVRSAHFSVRVDLAAAPHDTAHARLFYPAAPTGSDSERLTGEIPPDRTGAPLPVVVMLPAVNVGADSYRWLAVELVRRGFAAVTYDHVGELMPGQVGLSPGIDLAALGPGNFGTRPSATALGPILAGLESINTDGPLAGMLDLGHVALGGHSAGGTVALENADPQWFPGVASVFSYGSHTMPVAVLGHPEGAVLPVGPVPALVVAGAEDGVINASSDRYGREVGAEDHSPVDRTFAEGIRRGSTGYEVVLAGSNHLLVCSPADPTSARGFLDAEPSTDPEAARRLYADVVEAFLRRHLLGDDSVGPLALLDGSPLAVSARGKGPGAG